LDKYPALPFPAYPSSFPLNALLDGISALLNGLGTLLHYAVWGFGALFLWFWLMMALDGEEHTNWPMLLALVCCVGFPVVGILLAPLVPYGNIFSVGLLLLSPTVAYWIVASHCPPDDPPTGSAYLHVPPVICASYFALTLLNILYKMC